ncbi:MAG: DUF5689 domain-containing protein [Rikenellaceae bacterium]
MGSRVIFSLLLLLAGCYNSFPEADEDGASVPTPNITLAELHALCGEQTIDISANIVITGTVTATDQSGNIYKSYYIEQEGYGVQILEGLYDSYLRHPVGYQVNVALNGLSLSRYNGVLQIGIATDEYSYYALDYLTAEALIDQHIYLTASYEQPSPREVSIEDLNSSMCGSLIKIDSLTFINSEEENFPTWSGERYFCDRSLSQIIVETSSYANFSQIEIPSIECSITGILLQDDDSDEFIITMRDVEDITTL